MKLPLFAATIVKRWQTQRLLRALLKEQRRTADALDRQAHILNAIGQILAANSHRAWPLYTVAQSQAVRPIFVSIFSIGNYALDKG